MSKTKKRERKIIKEYSSFQKEIQSVQDRTIRAKLIHIRPFLLHFDKIATPLKIRALKPKDVHGYIIKTAPKFSRKYQKEFICAPRSFFKFLKFYDYSSYD